MSMNNWIEVMILVAIIISGVLLKRYTMRKVSDIEGFSGVVKIKEKRGKTIGRL